MNLRKPFSIFLIFLASTWVLHTITSNLIVDPQLDKFLVHKLLSEDFNQALWLTNLRIHIVTACLVLITGLLGFSGRILTRSKGFHRINGQLYIASVFLAALSSLYLIADATGGIYSIIGFMCLELIWLYATARAYTTIRQGDVQGHRRWMIRSFALTFSNTTIHLYLGLLHYLLGLDYTLAYIIAVWASWSVNLTAAEIVLRKRSPLPYPVQGEEVTRR
ncbi:DUF2306 domain-containing protein [Tumebacillus permanentifrigoris]|uniref:Putative membrane protein n=1 Tax=Tumebacillus permanentifrigoris TaxID=378543 RepID=A0A316DPK3_9BACL|nr:DUF2306 domain-containing protein [Tumebacillus permanentifrigoris]PWK05016.1 putative membrane protein [Tumebacillus permanentifrigoris]